MCCSLAPKFLSGTENDKDSASLAVSFSSKHDLILFLSLVLIFAVNWHTLHVNPLTNPSLVPPRQPDGEDDLKKRQLMELAIINGTYRDTTKPPPGHPVPPPHGRKFCKSGSPARAANGRGCQPTSLPLSLVVRGDGVTQ